MKSGLFYHLVALVVVGIWGVTFINSKILLQHGLTPHEIFELRFLLAYVCIWFISPRKWFADSWKDEFLMVVLGITGGSFYFLAENTAVGLTYVNNVSFIITTNPLITTFLSIWLLHNVKPTRNLLLGSLVAILGVALVIYNGSFVLRLNPLGDILTLLAGFSWAVYSLLIKNVSGRYDITFITRKVFGYGLLTMLPVFLVSPWQSSLNTLADPVVWGNLLFLGFIASFACFALSLYLSSSVKSFSASIYSPLLKSSRPR